MLAPASWPEALAAAAAGLAAARGRAGVLTGGRLTLEDAYAYAKFTRVALGTNDIDLRARPHSAEESQFLAAAVAGRDVEVSYADLERAPAVLLAGFEPEDESPIIFLRLRKAARKGGIAIYSLAPFASSGLAKMSGTLLPTVPGGEADALSRLAGGPGTAETGAAGKMKAAVTRLTGGQKLDEAWAAAARRAGRRRRGDRGGRAAGRGAGRADRGGRPWPPRPARSWPGCRAAPGNAGRSTPAPCPACSRSAGPSGNRTRGPRWPGPGA